MEGRKGFELAAADQGSSSLSVDYINLMSGAQPRLDNRISDTVKADAGDRNGANPDKPEVRFDATRMQDALAAAHKSNREIVLDAGADWCIPCRNMDKETWGRTDDKAKFPGDPKVTDMLSKNYIFVKLDMDKSEDVAKQYKIESVPTLIVGKVTKNDKGEYVLEPRKRLNGYHSTNSILTELKPDKDK